MTEKSGKMNPESCLRTCKEDKVAVFPIREEFKDTNCITDDVYAFLKEMATRKPGNPLKPAKSIPGLPVNLGFWRDSKLNTSKFFSAEGDFRVRSIELKLICAVMPGA